MISKKINIIINLILEYFIKLNFNRKKEDFKKVHNNEFAYFFNDTIAKEINIHGVYEKEEIEVLSKLISSKDHVVDIGANIGNHSIAFSKISKKVYSFEAHPRTFEILKFNTDKYKNIKIFNIGISNKKGSLFFKNIITTNIGGKKLSKTGSIKSQINKLDNIIKSDKKIKLIKIDIEGHEHEALLGMKKLLSNNNSLILLEFCEESIAKRRKIINFLRDNNYLHSYYFSKEKKISNLGYLDLLIKIILTILFVFKKKKTKIIKIDFESLVINDLKENIIFSKKKIN
jgi:FkbM family methyltransferase